MSGCSKRRKGYIVRHDDDDVDGYDMQQFGVFDFLECLVIWGRGAVMVSLFSCVGFEMCEVSCKRYKTSHK